MDLVEHPFLIFVFFVGDALVATAGIVLLAIGLYGFCRWVEVKKVQFKRARRRKKHLHYKDML